MDRHAVKKLVLIITTVALICLLVAGSATTAAAAETTGGDVVLRVGWTTDPDNLNPFIGWASASFEVWALNYDTLVGYDPEDFTPTNTGLAESWEVSADGKTYTFHLHDGVTWQDGEPFTADDVAFTYNYIIENSLYAFSIATTGIKKAVVVDPLTVKIVCTRPKADLLSIWVPILPEHIWAKVSPKAAGSSYSIKLPIVGTGPYQCVEFKKGSYVRMVANRSYFRGAPHLDEIVFETYQNSDTMTSDLKSGVIDAAQGIPRAQFDSVAATEGLEAVAYNYRNWDYLCVNCSTAAASGGSPVLKDTAFRQALNWAINKQRLVEVAWGGRAETGTTILPPDEWIDPDYHWEPSEEAAYGYDPDKAAELLDEAGYRDTDGDGVRENDGKPIALRLFATAESAEQQSEARLIVGQLKAVGISVKLTIGDEGVLTDMVWNYQNGAYAPDYDLYVSAWDGYFDPGQTLSCFTSGQIEGWNEACWSNEEFDELCDQQAVTLDTTERQKLIWNMQEIMYTESPEIVLTYPQYLQAYNTSRWTGWTRVLGGKGPAFSIAMADSYLNLQPAAEEESGGGSTLWVAAAGVCGVVVLGVVVWRLARRRHDAEEE